MINIFGYKKNNLDSLNKKIISLDSKIVLLTLRDIKDNQIEIKPNEYYNFSFIPKLVSDDNRWIEMLFDLAKQLGEIQLNVMIDREYFIELQKFPMIDGLINLKIAEEVFNLEYTESIITISPIKFSKLNKKLDSRLVGNDKFKQRLMAELRKFRLFNKIGEQLIFSCILFGESGIGKTETARILADFLSPNEKMIKINFGNYSGEESLSSLIGSPRGYIGSKEGGELSKKISLSNSKVILIDEFEKSNPTIQNFFLELLEDGKFTDSMGREFDLNQYIIVFTSNVKNGKELERFSPELLSRFNLRYRFSNLSSLEKLIIAQSYEDKIIDKIINEFNIENEQEFTKEDLTVVDEINLKESNVRNIKDEIKLKLSERYFNISGI